jgi:2,3-bisphosphoglycerate-independent phosphoglycerate mutase
MKLPDDLVQIPSPPSRILLVVLDGLGGLPHPDHGKTELEAARTPHLDALAARSSLGMHTPIAPGVTPGSGPAHLALFGYDPLTHPVGRGALGALGVGLDLEPGDVAIRVNLASLDEEGRITDRRAGRPSDAVAKEAVAALVAGVDLGREAEATFVHEKEHRVVLRLRGEGLGADLIDTDPQTTGVPALDPAPIDPSDTASARTAALLRRLVAQARSALVPHPGLDGLLLRGVAPFAPFPSMETRFGLRAAAHARYPMYRGVARLVGMTAPGAPATDADAVAQLEAHWGAYDLHFLHIKGPDARGEDGDFDAKVAAIEEVDASWIPRLAALDPDVLLVTGDHSTPAAMAAHSWHPVPVLLQSRWSRPTATTWGESTARSGDLGTLRGVDLMAMALAHAGRLRKLGA